MSTYAVSLFEGGAIPPQVAVGGQLAEILYFGDAPGYPGYFQINFEVPAGVTPGSSVPVANPESFTRLCGIQNAILLGNIAASNAHNEITRIERGSRIDVWLPTLDTFRTLAA